MLGGCQILDPNTDISELNAIVYRGEIEIKAAAWYRKFSMNAIHLWMLKHGIYVVPTQELVDFIETCLIGTAIEIGAGNGSIARALGILATDNKMQTWPEVVKQYQLAGQPLIYYPKDVIKMDAHDAISEYKPDTVIGAFITHRWLPGMDSGNQWGVIEEAILLNCRRYINVGNAYTHAAKPILKHKHRAYSFPWIITRAINQELNRIWIWDANSIS